MALTGKLVSVPPQVGLPIENHSTSRASELFAIHCRDYFCIKFFKIKNLKESTLFNIP